MCLGDHGMHIQDIAGLPSCWMHVIFRNTVIPKGGCGSNSVNMCVHGGEGDDSGCRAQESPSTVVGEMISVCWLT